MNTLCTLKATKSVAYNITGFRESAGTINKSIDEEARMSLCRHKRQASISNMFSTRCKLKLNEAEKGILWPCSEESRGWSEAVGGVLVPAAGLAGLGALRPGRADLERLQPVGCPCPAPPAVPLRDFGATLASDFARCGCDRLTSLDMEGRGWGLWRRPAKGPDPCSWRGLPGVVALWRAAV
jgi:hypothetical protein